MSNVIHLLEKMGQNAEFRYAKAEELTELMADTDPALVRAVIAGDQHQIETLLGARSNVVCGVYPAEEPGQDEPSEEEREDEKVRQQIAI